MTTGLDAAELTRTWPYVTAAARAARRQIQHRDPNASVERIALIADGLYEANQRHKWPGPGPSDAGFARVVRELVKASRSRTPVETSDAKEAHRLIGTTMWVTSHVLARESRDHLLDLQYAHSHSATDSRTARIPRLTELKVQTFVGDVVGRATACEYLAESSLHDHPNGGDVWAVDLAGAVATWDQEVHRALLTIRSTSTLALVGRVESSMHSALAHVLTRATPDSAITPDTAARLAPTLRHVGDAWESLVQRVMDLSWGSEPVPRSLLRSADTLRDQFQNATIPGSTAAGRLTMAEAISSYLSSSVAISVAARELVHDGELRAPARAVNTILLEARQTSPGSFKNENLAALVSPRDLERGLSIPLPPAAQHFIATELNDVCIESMEALRRSVRLETTRTPEPTLDAPATEPPLASAHLPGLGISPRPLSPPI